jgi:hypothetical protein
MKSLGGVEVFLHSFLTTEESGHIHAQEALEIQ